MANWNQFDEKEIRPIECEVFETMCPDAVDGTLTEGEQRVFDRHAAECGACRRELAEAQRGSAWLGMLKGQTPEPPPTLMAKILAETTGVEGAAVPAAALTQPVREPAPAWALSSVLRKLVVAFRMESVRPTLQPRLAMTAAMAFVSIALTLNLTGVRLGKLRASSFTPSGVRRTVTDASASAARSFQNIRVVYQVESRVSELRGEGPLADQDQQPSFAEPQPASGATNDSGIIRRPRQ